MHKAQTEIFELLKNEAFVQWVQAPTEESAHYWVKWIANHPERRKDVEAARRLIQSSRLSRQVDISDEAYGRILENIVSYSLHRKTNSVGFVARLWRPLAMAASISLVLLASLYALWDQPELSGTDSSVVTWIEKEAPVGGRITTKLPDGTTVVLNAGSRISFPEQFIENTRNVILTGEAFFKVQRDEEHPFIIRTSGVDVRVLGTSFNVRSFPEDPNINVAVMEGKVAVSSQETHERVVLVEDEMATYSGADGKLIKESIPDQLSVFGWKEGSLVFKDDELQKIAKSLTRWYGVEFEIDLPDHQSKLITATFRNASLREVMESLSHTYHFNYQINGKTVTIN